MKQNNPNFFTGDGLHRTVNIAVKGMFGARADNEQSSAQMAAIRECQHPQQARVQQHEPFEPHGMN